MNQEEKGEKVFVVGNGMTKFYKPGKHSYEYADLANIAMKRALDDVSLNFKDSI
jgi:hypothetical protein